MASGRVIFKEHVYHAPYSSHYDEYKGQVFIVDHFHPEDRSNEHVWLKCVTDESIKVKGYVDIKDIENEPL